MSKLLDAFIRDRVAGPRDDKKLWVFDFDDTLVRTRAQVRLVTESGDVRVMTSSEFARHPRQPTDTFDFSDFHRLVDPRPVKWACKLLHAVCEHHTQDNVVVLSARDVAAPIEEFLASLGLPRVHAAAVGSGTHANKASWLEHRVHRDGIRAVEAFDDSWLYVQQIRQLQERLPHVEIVARHVHHRRVASIHRL